MLLLYSLVPAGPRSIEQAGSSALMALILFWLACPFVFVYWTARIVRGVWRGSRHGSRGPWLTTPAPIGGTRADDQRDFGY